LTRPGRSDSEDLEFFVSTVPAKLDESWLTTEVGQIYRVACRLTGNPHDAEDLVQDVCERALRKAPPLASADDCRRWLLRVLYNRFVDGTRHRQRSPLVAAGGSEPESQQEAPDSETLAVQSEGESELERAWARLEPDQQMLLLLRAEGYDLDDISRIAEADKPALSSRLHRARSSLARYLEQERSVRPLRAVPEKPR
jgi:RNA polymerase sigma-70 factor, ECF subfamily